MGLIMIVQKLLEEINDWHSPLPDKIQMNPEYYERFCKEVDESYNGLFLFDWSKGKRGKVKEFCRVPIEVTTNAFLGYCFVHVPK